MLPVRRHGLVGALELQGANKYFDARQSSQSHPDAEPKVPDELFFDP
jgi:hypothetical protein